MEVNPRWIEHKYKYNENNKIFFIIIYLCLFLEIYLFTVFFKFFLLRFLFFYYLFKKNY
jgi:hypothetical protein